MSRRTHDGPDLGLTADRSRVVLVGDPESAFQLVASGSAVPSEFADLYAEYMAKASEPTPEPEPEKPVEPAATTPKPKKVRRQPVKKS